MPRVDFSEQAPLVALPALKQVGDAAEQQELITVTELTETRHWPTPGATLQLGDTHQDVRRFPGELPGIVAGFDVQAGVDGDSRDLDGQMYRIIAEDDASALAVAELTISDPRLSPEERIHAEHWHKALRAGMYVVFAATHEQTGGSSKTGYHDLVVTDVLSGPSVFGFELPYSLPVTAAPEGNQTLSLKGGAPYTLGTVGNRSVLTENGGFDHANVLSFPDAIANAIRSLPELSNQPVQRVVADMCLRVYELLTVESAEHSLRSGKSIDTLTLAHMDNTRDGFVFWEAAFEAGQWMVETINSLPSGNSFRLGQRKDVNVAVPMLDNKTWDKLIKNRAFGAELSRLLDAVSEAASEDTMIRMAHMHTTRIDRWYRETFERSQLASMATEEQAEMMNEMVGIARTNPVRLLMKSVGVSSSNFDASLAAFVEANLHNTNRTMASLATAAQQMLSIRRKQFSQDGDSSKQPTSLVVSTVPTRGVPMGSPYPGKQNEVNVRVEPPFIDRAGINGGRAAMGFSANFAVEPAVGETGFPSANWVRSGGAPGMSGVVCAATWRPTPEQAQSFPPAIVTGTNPEDLPPQYVVVNVGAAPNMIATALRRLGPNIRGARLSQLLSVQNMSGRYALVRGDQRVEVRPGVEGNTSVRTSMLRRVASFGPGQELQVFMRDSPTPYTNDMIDARVVRSGSSVQQPKQSLLHIPGRHRNGAETGKHSPNDQKRHIGTFVSGHTLGVVGPKLTGEESFFVVRPR